MKKIVCLIGTIATSFIIGGCNTTAENCIPRLNNKIEGNVKISSANEEYECRIFHTPEKITTLTFISPDNLKDFTISCREGMYEVTQGELEGEYTKNPLPKNSGIRNFIEILNNLSNEERIFKLKKEEEGERIYSGLIENKECSIVLGKNDNLIRISIQNPELEVEFKS